MYVSLMVHAQLGGRAPQLYVGHHREICMFNSLQFIAQKVFSVKKF